MLPANVYIDGFNLYYGCIKNTPYKWLDLSKFCRAVAPSHCKINEIKYFTARVSGRAADPGAPLRQQVYLRALSTLPSFSIIFGHFLSRETRMPLARPPLLGRQTVDVIRTDEKGSDVNLATHLLMDAFEKKCAAAVVISNDSDLRLPIDVAQSRYGVEVHVVAPHSSHPSSVLQRAAKSVRTVRPGALKSSLFPDVLTDANGTITKPVSW